MSAATIRIYQHHLPFLNISHYLHNIPLFSELVISNTGDVDTDSLQVTITADISCLEPFSCAIALLPANRDYTIPLDELRVNRSFLSTISETEKAVIHIRVFKQEVELTSDTCTILVHPLEYFGGFQVLPELIAAYVTPNHPYVYYLKNRAIEVLLKRNLQPAFEGYQSGNPERVLQLISAIYSAIQAEEIVYSALAPGYEETGQRLRLPDTIQKEGFANCIDLSLLFAACLEAVDLHPILIITRGHAFVGCWLHDDKFAEVVNDDKTAITKRLSKGIREMAATEATTLCRGSQRSFTEALQMGEAQLVENEQFLLSVDIKRARAARIRPLPLIYTEAGSRLDEAAAEKELQTNIDHQFNLGAIYMDDLTGSATLSRQKIWERKLLDLSLRNNLLNLRMTRNMLQLVDIDIHHLEDILAEGRSFTIQPDALAQPLYKYNLMAPPLHASSPQYQTATEELQHNRLCTYYHQTDLDNILAYIHKNARLSIEENGSSTLYLALGLLKWYDIKTPEQARFAPILLLPVELNRRSVNSRFTLKSREEEAMINITLLEFLKQEYKMELAGLEQLPSDEKGVDVARLMAGLRRAIMQQKGWDIEERLILGNFSFNKLILWKDIALHTQDLTRSPMVNSLIEGKLHIDIPATAPLPTDFDNIPPQHITLPIATDVSQLEAVLTAQGGSSFVLHGPPGTGKSQTITNIIADALNRGKKVLFVAAKKAALDVVHKRLAQIGLAPFSLELHSNKSKKSDVLAQLEQSLSTAKTKQHENFDQEALRLSTARSAISTYVNILHQQQPAGWSLYDSITTLETFRNTTLQQCAIPEEVLQNLQPTLWQQWLDWLPQFQSILSVIIHPADNPLSVIRPRQYTPQVQETIAIQTNQLLQLLPVADQLVGQLLKAIHFPYTLQHKNQWEQLLQILAALEALPDIALEQVIYWSDKENYAIYEEWSTHMHRWQQLLQQIPALYNREIVNADIANLEAQWRHAQQSWLLPRWLQKRKIKKQLNRFCVHPITTDATITALFAWHQQLREEQYLLQQQRFHPLQLTLKSLYKEAQTDTTAIDLKATLVQRLQTLLQIFDRNALANWMRTLQQQQFSYSDDIKKGQQSLWQQTVEKTHQTIAALNNYVTSTDFVIPATNDWLDRTVTQLQLLQLHLPRLKDWINYLQTKQQGQSLQLQWLITAYEEKRYGITAVHDFFLFNIHRAVAQQIIASHESLSLFNNSLFESKIDQYKKIAREYQLLTIQELRAKLASRLPNTTAEAMQSSEIGILQRAIKNKGRGMSIRRLFDQIPTLLPRLAPCMLMSPISVAQYFTMDPRHFDLVIFDEASQLPTCEAVSALARAQQAIVVGDPKQMPPTSFFSTNKVDEENLEIEDLESILDDCLALSVPSRYLLRHYRSKHESLIAFSNASYYDNKLLTFPSADDLNRKVKYHHIKGHYDKGKTRTNRFEAEAIAQFIQSLYTNPQTKNKSIGVVTFSQTQQQLVEDRLLDLFKTDSGLEQWATESAEPLFIKNLENVQGDERDIVLFSVGYAPDETAKMSMNFGPLNRNGGWRRLNVAVTRARYEMHVFATLRADQIDLNRTAAAGVAGLKAFLQFAEKGQLVFRPEHLPDQLPTQALAIVIGKKLQDKGWPTKHHIGTSDFKMDVAVIHPDKPDQYLLGILLDGSYYYNARTANDREMVLPAVLNGLGWQLHRIWAMDWYENAERIIDSIVEKLQDLRQGMELRPIESVSDTVIDIQYDPAASPTMENEMPSFNSKQRPYITHTLSIVPNANSDSIYDFQNRKRIKQQLQMLIDAEEPISKGLLYKKLLIAWNTSRVGAKLDKHLEGILDEMPFQQTQHQQPFYWSAQTQPDQLDFYRYNDIEKRAIEDIAPEEIMVALVEVVQHNLSIDEEELLRYLARSFAFAKVGKQIELQLRYVIDIAEKKGTIKREGGRVKIAENN